MGAEDKDARTVLTHAHALNPEEPSVRHLLAQELSIATQNFARNQDCHHALELLEKTVSLQPESRQISTTLAKVRAGCTTP
jgi:hypothetical protein